MGIRQGRLTPAEARVVLLLREGEGLSNKAMAQRHRSHMSSALAKKTGCLNRLELLLWSLSPGIDLVELDNSSDILY